MKVKKLSNKQIEKYAEEMDLIYLQPGTWYDFYSDKGQEHRELMFIATLYKTNNEIILAFLDKDGKQATKTIKAGETSKTKFTLNELTQKILSDFYEKTPATQAYLDCTNNFNLTRVADSPIWQLVEEAINYALSVVAEYEVIEE